VKDLAGGIVNHDGFASDWMYVTRCRASVAFGRKTLRLHRFTNLLFRPTSLCHLFSKLLLIRESQLLLPVLLLLSLFLLFDLLLCAALGFKQPTHVAAAGGALGFWFFWGGRNRLVHRASDNLRDIALDSDLGFKL